MLYLDVPKKGREEQHMRKKLHKAKIRLPLRKPEPVASAPVEVEPIAQEPVAAAKPKKPKAGQTTLGEIVRAQEQGFTFAELLQEAPAPRKVIPYAEFAYRRRERQQKIHLQQIRERRLRERL
jgi:hypothetical protein